MILQAQNLTKSFGADVLFEGVTFLINDTDRVALVGPNGAGKTTMLRIIAGLDFPDSGQVVLSKGRTIGYMEQESIELGVGVSVLDEVLSGVQDVLDQQARMMRLSEEISSCPEGPEQERLLAEYARASEAFERGDGYAVDSRARAIVAGLGFSEEDALRNCEEFSGGWQMRIALAKLLMRQVDVLLLDEPTNHLDLESVRWLEGYLRSYGGAVVIVSHDRDFMDGMVDRVLELDAPNVIQYTGNYSDYERQREERIARIEAEAAAQAEEIARMEAFVEKFRYKATKAKQVQDRVKKLEKIERIKVPSRAKRIRFKFPQPPRSGMRVAVFEGVRKAYGDKVVYESLDFEVFRGDKIALVGPNGAGKSTLMKMICGAEKPSAGSLKLGENVRISYFSQHQLEHLDPRSTVFEELDRAAPGWTISQVRSLLGAFLFSGDDADKRVSVLSGGEKCRLALAKMLVSPTSLLCLDEPTNHLDVSSVEVLCEALAAFDGTLVLISHDRHLIRTVANKVVHVEGGKLDVYDGGYDYFLEKTEGASAGPSAPGPGPAASAASGASGASGTPSASAASAAPLGASRPSSDGRSPRRTHTAARAAEAAAIANPPAGYRTKEQRRADAEARKRRSALVREESRRIAEIDDELEGLSARKAELVRLMADESLYADAERSKEVAFEYNDVKRAIDSLEDEWMELTERMEHKLASLESD